ncbi:MULTISPECIES: tail fiber assembly protein [Serratia]|uniref:tail fiber assembly protein n=1 Tax=Serratia TaxID=613 RepID=UPI0018A7A628|nr:tail fiber assembly protein [Serratia ureilytica]MBF4186409.1 tail fiber assembly protein [Serratia ureilytica]MBF8439526.1 tail fiber assembly protein [Serratia ureilytica]MBF8443648.1 tail fiber assembly protein [Serratia ureilytica]
MNYGQVKKCRTTNIKKYIDCDVIFPDLSDSPISFTAMPNDSTEHGRDIYNRALNGEFGVIVIAKKEVGYYWDGNEFVEYDFDIEALHFDEMKNRLISEASQKISILSDAVDLGIATDEEKVNIDKWKQYRVLVNRMSKENGSGWPEKPAD